MVQRSRGARCGRALLRYKDAASEALAEVLRGWGALVSARPWTVIAVSGLVSAFAAVGFMRVRVESSIDKLWLPQNSRIQSNEARYGQYFDLSAGALRIVARDHSGSEHGMLTPERVQTLFKLRQGMYSVSASNTSVSDICVPSSGAIQCSEVGLPTLWCSIDDFEQDVMQSETPTSVLRQRVTQSIRCDNTSASLSETCGLPTYSSKDNATIIGCEAVKSDVLVTSGESSPVYQAFASYMSANSDAFGTDVTTAYFYPTIAADAVSDQVSSGYHLWAVAYGLVFTLLSVSQWRKDPRESRPLLSFLGIITVALANIGAYGVLIAAGRPITNLELLLPFLIVALGVDDVLILTESMREYRHVQPDAEVHEHVRQVMGEAGLSTLVASLTDMFAFLLGGQTPLPAVQMFGNFAALTVMWLWMMIVSFFLGCMVLVERRKRSQHNMSEVPANGAGISHLTTRVSGGIGRFLMRWPVRIVVLALTLVFAGLAASRIPKVEGGLPLSDLGSRNSVLEKQEEIRYKTFGRMRGIRIFVCFDKPSDGIGLGAANVQNQMLDGWKAMTRNDFISNLQSQGGTTPNGNFLTSLIEYAANRNQTQACDQTLLGSQESCDGAIVESDNAVVPGSSFANVTESFLQANQRLAAQVSLSGVARNGTIVDDVSIRAVCLPTYAKAIGNDFGERLDIFRDVLSFEDTIRSRYKEKTGEDGLFVYGRRLTIFEHDVVLQQTVVRNLLLAAMGVFIIALLLLQSFIGALMSIIAVGIVDVSLFGIMWIKGIRLNVVSASAIILAIGLAVDYQLHFMHTFLRKKHAKTSSERVVLTFSSPIPKAVLLGGLTTFFGIVPLAASTSNIFFTYFQLISFSVAVGLWSGLIFSPALASLLPNGVYPQQQSEETYDEHRNGDANGGRNGVHQRDAGESGSDLDYSVRV